MTTLFRIGLVAFEVVDRRAHLFALLPARTNRIYLVPYHLQGLKRNHDFVVLDEVAG